MRRVRPDLRQKDAGAGTHPHRPRRTGPEASAAAGALTEQPTGRAGTGGHHGAAAACDARGRRVHRLEPHQESLQGADGGADAGGCLQFVAVDRLLNIVCLSYFVCYYQRVLLSAGVSPSEIVIVIIKCVYLFREDNKVRK